MVRTQAFSLNFASLGSISPPPLPNMIRVKSSCRVTCFDQISKNMHYNQNKAQGQDPETKSKEQKKTKSKEHKKIDDVIKKKNVKSLKQLCLSVMAKNIIKEQKYNNSFKWKTTFKAKTVIVAKKSLYILPMVKSLVFI